MEMAIFLAVCAVIIVVVSNRMLANEKKVDNEVQSAGSQAVLAKPSGPRHFEGDAEFDFEVAGESNYQRHLEMIAGPRDGDGVEFECVADLIPEPSNPYDPKAIRVDVLGKTVGYVPRDMTPALHHVLRGRSAQADALIVGGWLRANGDEGHFGIKLDISLPARFE